MDACGTPGVALSRDCGTDVEALLHYVQGVLSKLSAAKELMKEILAREKKKTAEREAAKVPPPSSSAWCMHLHIQDCMSEFKAMAFASAAFTACICLHNGACCTTPSYDMQRNVWTQGRSA